MFEPWPVSAGDGEDQDCDCDECGVSKRPRPKRRRCLILPSGEEDAGIQPQAPVPSPPVPSAPTALGAPGAPSTHLTAQTGSERDMGPAAEPVAEPAAAVEPAAGLGADTETAPQLDEWRSGAQGAPRLARHTAPPARRTRVRPSDTGSLAWTLGTVHEPGAWIAVQG